jgi:hypothetical protein
MYEVDPDNAAYIAEPEARHGYFNLVVGIHNIDFLNQSIYCRL